MGQGACCVEINAVVWILALSAASLSCGSDSSPSTVGGRTGAGGAAGKDGSTAGTGGARDSAAGGQTGSCNPSELRLTFDGRAQETFPKMTLGASATLLGWYAEGKLAERALFRFGGTDRLTDSILITDAFTEGQAVNITHGFFALEATNNALGRTFCAGPGSTVTRRGNELELALEHISATNA